ncbi:hypothetical protein [Mycolicibacterium mucogenicum]|uniref:hypothetical protein n=1 Tax=Mycolicibacterium mucogenicum TaxID=56689 RepID=UPI0013A534DE|nr:hypothetical protein [Mycolicibacterium mucogenicum]
MTDLRVNGVPQRPVFSSADVGLTIDRLRTIVQDSHLNFLIGAGTPAAFFGLLGNIEEALTELVDVPASDEAKAIVRASIQAYFFGGGVSPEPQGGQSNCGDRDGLDVIRALPENRQPGSS